MSDDRTVTLHASTVAVEGNGKDALGRAIVIEGPSGSGKSGLALRLMALGARLVADDRTIVTREGDRLIARAPDSIAGLIEARYVGLLPARALARAEIVGFLSLSETETDRLPPHRTRQILGLERPLLHNSAAQHFAAALLHYLTHGRKD